MGVITTDVVYLTPQGLQIPRQGPVFCTGFKVSSSKVAPGAMLAFFASYDKELLEQAVTCA